MEPNPRQFAGIPTQETPKLKPLNKNVKRFYPQVTEQLNIAIKQAKLDKLRRELGESSP
jgi:hypothetical protein